MNSNKSIPAPGKKRVALVPQRSHGKLRVAALLDAGAAVIAEKGFPAATMAEIAARAGAPIGSLYRFFPNKEILADALVQRFGELIEAAFGEINSRVKSLSPAALAEAFLKILVDLHGEKPAIRALLEAHPGWSAKRAEFRAAIRRNIAKTLKLRSPHLDPETAGNMAVIILQNMKTVGVLGKELRGKPLSGALAELHEMTRLYLAHKLGA
ncbi:MAG: helix-turn-helix domain-containing protein [Chthoniobacteraceae bacterium]